MIASRSQDAGNGILHGKAFELLAKITVFKLELKSYSSIPAGVGPVGSSG